MLTQKSSERSLVGRNFFERSPLVCARDLIGCVLVHGEVSGSVVETEAYDCEDDAACHTFFRPSTRAFVADHPAGTAYVYMNYGVHWLFNVLVKGPRSGFVLVRALEPITGQSQMAARRKSPNPLAWCSGPGKLTQALALGRSHHGIDVCAERSEVFLLSAWLPEPEQIVADARIGISAAKELPWRFTLRGSPYVSRKPGIVRPLG